MFDKSSEEIKDIISVLERKGYVKTTTSTFNHTSPREEFDYFKPFYEGDDLAYQVFILFWKLPKHIADRENLSEWAVSAGIDFCGKLSENGRVKIELDGYCFVENADTEKLESFAKSSYKNFSDLVLK